MNWRKHPPELLVYGLIDPRDQCIHYVGMTEKGLVRPFSHWKDRCVLRSNDRCHRWIRSVLRDGCEPEIVVLEHPLNRDEMKDLERFWICSIKAAGGILTNQNEGGSGGRIEGIRQKLSDAGKKTRGRKHSDETKAAISRSQRGHKMPEHVRRILSVVNKGRIKTIEEIEKRKQKVIGRKRPDFASKMRKKTWFSSPDGSKSKMFDLNAVPDGWVRGRGNFCGPEKGPDGKFKKK